MQQRSRNMSVDPSDAWNCPSVRLAVNISLVLSLVLTVMVWFTASRVPPEVPLHFARPWGNPQLVSRSTLWLVAGVGVVSTALHAAAAASIFKRDMFMASVIVWSSVLFLLLLLLAIMVVYVRVGPVA